MHTGIKRAKNAHNFKCVSCGKRVYIKHNIAHRENPKVIRCDQCSRKTRDSIRSAKGSLTGGRTGDLYLHDNFETMPRVRDIGSLLQLLQEYINNLEQTYANATTIIKNHCYQLEIGVDGICDELDKFSNPIFSEITKKQFSYLVENYNRWIGIDNIVEIREFIKWWSHSIMNNDYEINTSYIKRQFLKFIDDYRETRIINIDAINRDPNDYIDDARELISQIERQLNTNLIENQEIANSAQIKNEINLRLKKLGEEIRLSHAVIFRGLKLFFSNFPTPMLYIGKLWLPKDFKHTYFNRGNNSFFDKNNLIDNPVYISCISRNLYFCVFTPYCGIYSILENKMLDQKHLDMYDGIHRNMPPIVKTSIVVQIFKNYIVMAIPRQKTTGENGYIQLLVLRFDGKNLYTVATNYTTISSSGAIKPHEYRVGGIYLNSDYITICFNFNTKHPITVYNWKLEYVKSFGQREDKSKPFYIPPNVNWFWGTDTSYLVKNDTNLRFIDKNTGISNHGIDMGGDVPTMLAAENGNFIWLFVDAEHDQVSLYKFNSEGSVVMIDVLVGITNRITPCVDVDGEFSLVDLENGMFLTKRD